VTGARTPSWSRAAVLAAAAALLVTPALTWFEASFAVLFAAGDRLPDPTMSLWAERPLAAGVLSTGAATLLLWAGRPAIGLGAAAAGVMLAAAGAAAGLVSLPASLDGATAGPGPAGGDAVILTDLTFERRPMAWIAVAAVLLAATTVLTAAQRSRGHR
jgi:hypothetical protein